MQFLSGFPNFSHKCSYAVIMLKKEIARTIYFTINLHMRGTANDNALHDKGHYNATPTNHSKPASIRVTNRDSSIAARHLQRNV